MSGVMMPLEVLLDGTSIQWSDDHWALIPILTPLLNRRQHFSVI